VPVFVDTNVLVSARDTTDPDKHARALDWVRHLWDTGEGRLSIQVLQEYYVTTTRNCVPDGVRIVDPFREGLIPQEPPARSPRPRGPTPT